MGTTSSCWTATSDGATGGRWSSGSGPVSSARVLSYFEFTESDLTRLSDAEWGHRVERGKHHDARPEWVESYMVQ